LILSKVVKIVATSRQISRLKCTKFDFGWGPPRPGWESLHRSHRPLAGFKGATSKCGPLDFDLQSKNSYHAPSRLQSSVTQASMDVQEWDQLMTVGSSTYCVRRLHLVTDRSPSLVRAPGTT